jgi:hypothetical protein
VANAEAVEHHDSRAVQFRGTFLSVSGSSTLSPLPSSGTTARPFKAVTQIMQI